MQSKHNKQLVPFARQLRKEMLLADNVGSKEFLTTLLNTMCADLPAPKKKK